MQGLSYSGDTSSRGEGGIVIDPRLTTQFTSETHSPQKLSEKAGGLAAMALGTSAWQPIYFSMLAQLRGAPVAQKLGKHSKNSPVVWIAFLAEFS